MKFVIGYAGIPSDVYDEVYKLRDHICTRDPNCEFISRPLQSTHEGQVSYTQSHTNFFLKEFANRLKQDDHNKLIDTGFALICVEHDAASIQKFVDCFFPSVFTITVPCNLDYSSKQSIGKSKNNLVELLWNATNEVKNSIPVVKKEITEHDNKTPLLLPVKNFDSKCLVQELKRLQVDLGSAQDKMVVLKNHIQNIEHHHPRQKLDTDMKPCFVDNKKIEFHPPGKERHAFARISDAHPETCLLAGRRRLGAPYDHVFHYDCERGRGNLKGLFWECHGGQSDREGRPHLNIAPNDFVR